MTVKAKQPTSAGWQHIGPFMFGKGEMYIGPSLLVAISSIDDIAGEGLTYHVSFSHRHKKPSDEETTAALSVFGMHTATEDNEDNHRARHFWLKAGQ